MAAGTSNPNLTDVLRGAVQGGLAQVRVSMPAVVTAYDHTNQTATIQLAVQEKRRMKGQEQPQNYDVPPIPNVPVAFPAGSKWAVAGKLEAGDTGVAIFCHRSLSEWKATGGQGKSGVAAQDARRFNFGDAIFFPGVQSPADSLPAGAVDPDGHLVLWADDGLYLKLGSKDASQIPASMAYLMNELQKIQYALDTLTGGPSGYLPDPAPSTKVRFE